jgi:aspartate ammonia-lyase
VRAKANFKISERPVAMELVYALTLVKKAACQMNMELGYINLKRGGAILTACDELVSGQLDDQFELDALQGGAGTSTNMNVNEVLANRALELLELSKGNYLEIHPLESINLHQSTNDVYPTALK